MMLITLLSLTGACFARNLYHSHELNPSASECFREGSFRYPNDCRKFYRCVDWDHEGTHFSIFHFVCPAGTVFDEDIQVCNFPWWTKPCEQGMPRPPSVLMPGGPTTGGHPPGVLVPGGPATSGHPDIPPGGNPTGGSMPVGIFPDGSMTGGIMQGGLGPGGIITGGMIPGGMFGMEMFPPGHLGSQEMMMGSETIGFGMHPIPDNGLHPGPIITGGLRPGMQTPPSGFDPNWPGTPGSQSGLGGLQNGRFR